MWQYLASALVGILLSNMYNNNKEAQKKEQEAFDLYTFRKNEYISSFQNQLINELSNDKQFCKKETNSIYNNYNNELNEYIDKIIKIENNNNLFGLRINKLLNKLSQKMSKYEVKHLNILLVGPSGVGKSFLINSILKLENNNKAETRITKPTTKEFNVYQSNKIPNIRFIDSRGIEKGKFNAETFIKEIKNYVENQELKGDPDKFIHCIWYCITGTRFEDIEEESLSQLSSIYDDSKLPIIVVYTQAIIPDYYNAINQEINKIKKNIEFIPVVAQDINLSDGTSIKSKNLDLLLYKSLEKSKNAVYSSVFSSLRKIVKNETELQLINNKNEVNNKLNEYMSSIENQNSLLELKAEEENIYNNIFNMLLFEGQEKMNINNQSNKVIRELINYLKEKNDDIVIICLNYYINQKSKILTNELIDIQAQVNREKNGALKKFSNRIQINEEIRPIIRNSIYEKVRNIEFTHYMKILPIKIVNLLWERIKNELLSIIDDISTKNDLIKIIQKQFQSILLNVQKFQF